MGKRPIKTRKLTTLCFEPGSYLSISRLSHVSNHQQYAEGFLLFNPSGSQVPAGKQFKIVLADDEKPILGIYSKILSRSGFMVTRTFENGKDLLDFIKMNSLPELEPDVIVSDLRMPVMDGIEAAKRIRSIKPKIKIILASAYDTPNEDVGLFDAILKKPFGSKELVDTVSRCIDFEYH
jgi:CheY-like chemotaxis protein